MSKVIDERVVEMRFDNKDFESNVQTSLKTIDKLKDSLNFDESTKSVEKFQDSLRHFSLDDIGQAVESLSEKFNWGNVFKIDLLNNIVESIYSTITGVFNRIKGELHLEDVDPVSNMLLGWDKYAEKTKSVATIMASTGKSMEYVNEQMDRLLYFSDETSYSFTDMTSNIGKFTANGIELEDSATAMQGIATWAARSGQNAQTASRVMYNLAQAIGMGALKLQDWKSVELANMGTKEFKEMAIEAGLATQALTRNAQGIAVINDETVGTAKETAVTIENFRETLKEGWLDNQTLMSTLKEYGKAAEVINDINAETGEQASKIVKIAEEMRGKNMSLKEFAKALDIEDLLEKDKNAVIELRDSFELLASEEYAFSLETYKAAQEARTFGDAMASVADYVGSRWMKTFELLFGGYEQAKVLWTKLAEDLATIFGDGIDARNELLEEANKSGFDNLKNSLAEAGVSMLDIEHAVERIVGGSQKLKALIGDAGSFEEAVKKGAISTKYLQQAIESLPGSFTRVREVAGEVTDNYEQMTEWSWELRKGMYGWDEGHDYQVQKLMEAKKITKEYAEQVVELSERHEELGRELTKEEAAQWLTYTQISKELEENIELTDEQREAWIKMLDEIDQVSFQESLRNGLMNIGSIVVEVFEQVRSAISGMFPLATAKQLRELGANFERITASILKFIKGTEDSSGILENIVTALIFPFRVLFDVVTATIKLIAPFGKLVLAVFAPIIGALDAFGAWLISIRKNTKELDPLAKIIDKVAEALSALLDYIAQVALYVGNIVKSKLVEKLAGPFQKLLETFNEFKNAKLTSLDNFINSIKKADVTKTGDKIVAFLRDLYQHFIAIGSVIVAPIRYFNMFFDFINSRASDLSVFQKVFTALRWTLTRVFDDIETELKKFGIDIGPLRKMLTDFVQDVGSNLTNLKNKITVIFNDFRNRFKGLGIASKDLNVLQRAFLALKGTLSDEFPSLDKIMQKLRELRQTIREFFLGTEDETNNGLFGSISEKLSNAQTAITNFFSGFKLQTEDGQSALHSFMDSLGNNLPKVLTGAGIALAGSGIFKFIKKLKETKDNKGGNFIEDMVKSIIPFSDSIEKLGTAVSSFNIVNFAIGMGLLAGALIAMSFVPTDRLVTSLGTLGASLAAFIGTIAAVNKVMGDAGTFRLVGMGLGMVMIAGSLLIFARAVRKFEELDIGSNGKIQKVLGGLLLATMTMSRLARVAGKNKFKLSNGLGLVATAGSLYLFAKAIERYANLKVDKDNVGKVLRGLLAAIVTLGLISAAAGNNNFKLSNGLAIVALAGSMLIFAKSIEKLGNIPEAVLKQGGIALGLLSAVVTAMMAIINSTAEDVGVSTGIGMFLSLAGLTIAIVAFAGIAAALGYVDQNALIQGMMALATIGGLVTLLLWAVNKLSEDLDLKKSIAIFVEMTAIVLAVTAFGAICAVLGFLSPVIALGLGCLLLILGEMYLAIKIIGSLAKSGNTKAMFAGIAMFALFSLSLIPLVAALTKLSQIDFGKTQKNMILLGELFAGFVGLIVIATVVGGLAKLAGPLLLVGIGVIAGVFALFVGAITVLVKDLERLAELDTEAARDGLECVKEELNILTDLARQFQEEKGLFTNSLGAAIVCIEFGKGLRKLAEDTFILGLANAEKASESLKVVQEEIELMMALGTMLVQNEGSFGKAILASAVAFSFGVGLHGLANDTKILGLVNAENAKAAMEPLADLISMMIGLAETIGTDVTLFGKALLTTADLIAFGFGLLPLVGAEFLAGLTDAKNASVSMNQISKLIDKLFDIATKISKDASLYFSAKAAAETIKDFGYALLPLVASEFISQFVDAEAATSSFKAAQEIIEWLVGIAGKFQGEDSINAGAGAAVDRLGGFAKSLAKLTVTDFISQFVDADRALEGLTPVQTIVDMLVGMVTELTANGSTAEAAKTAVESVKTFAESLREIIWMLSSNSIGSVDPTVITSVIDAILLGLSKLASINGDMASVGSALEGIGDIFSSLESLGTTGGLFGKKSIDTSSITDAFTAIGDSIVTLGTTIDTENIGGKIVNTIVTPLVTESVNAQNALLNMGQQMSNTIASFEQLFYVDGNNIAVGFINGINSQRQNAYNAGYGLAEDAERGTRDAGKIQSPSKVFSELGGYVGEGFINGIESKYGQISEAAQGMAQRAIQIVNDLRERMQQLLADKANELHITPVVDMADVSKLSEIMGNIQGSHNFAANYVHNAEIDSSINSKSYTPELRSLVNYVSQLGEHIDNMQMVLDTGALVGATSAKMDSQFGVMTMRRGRGN